MLENIDYKDLTIILSAIVCIATVIYVILTGALVRETRKMRRSQIKPHLIIYLDVAETNPHIIYLKIKNIGLGVALNVRFKIIKELDYHRARKISDYHYFKEGVNYFPPNHMDKFILSNIENAYNIEDKDSLIIEIDYEDILSNKTKLNYKIRLNEILDKGKLTPPDSEIGNIGYRLEKIEKILEKFLENKN